MGAAPTRKGLEGYLNGLDGLARATACTSGLDWKPVNWCAKTMARTASRSPAGRTARAAGCRPTQKFPFCYPDAKVYGSPALEQGN